MDVYVQPISATWNLASSAIRISTFQSLHTLW
jgi:hypothetical protein